MSLPPPPEPPPPRPAPVYRVVAGVCLECGTACDAYTLEVDPVLPIKKRACDNCQAEWEARVHSRPPPKHSPTVQADEEERDAKNFEKFRQSQRTLGERDDDD